MITVDRIGAVDVVNVPVPINDESIPELRECVDSLSQSGPTSLALNLAETPLLNSAGLEYLLSLQETCLKSGGSLKLGGPNQLCADILHITGLDEAIEIYSSVVEAAGSFSE